MNGQNELKGFRCCVYSP